MSYEEPSIYGRALAEAQTELRSIQEQYEKLGKRKAVLEAFIANTQPLVSVTVPTLDFPLENEVPSVPILKSKKASDPIWKSILLAINGKSESFGVKDALEALERIGRPITSPNKFQIARATLASKPEHFEKISPGVYRVKKEAETAEASEEAPTA